MYGVHVNTYVLLHSQNAKICTDPLLRERGASQSTYGNTPKLTFLYIILKVTLLSIIAIIAIFSKDSFFLRNGKSL